MIDSIRIKNFKSIVDLTFKPGRFTVLIGENGGGKSNVLEAVAMGVAALTGRLSSEFMITRGVRWTPGLMHSALNAGKKDALIQLVIDGTTISLIDDGKPHDTSEIQITLSPDLSRELEDFIEKAPLSLWKKIGGRIIPVLIRQSLSFSDFVIYAPENAVLRRFEGESRLDPMDIDGTGLFKQLQVIQEHHPDRWEVIKEKLRMISWFGDLDVQGGIGLVERHLQIKDRFLHKRAGDLTQRHVNEGFLFLLFHLTLVASPQTPSFFAIDNLESAFNPKLCTRLTQELVSLAKQYDKQVMVTTHNPAVLDGIDLGDPEQKIFVVSRQSDHATGMREVKPPKPLAGEDPVKLSEAFLYGMIGGLPKEF